MIVKVFEKEGGLQAVVMRGTGDDGAPDIRVISEMDDQTAEGMGASFRGCEEGHFLRDLVFFGVNSAEDVGRLLDMGLKEWIRGALEEEVALEEEKAGRGRLN
jgi:hypothetical protein